MDIKEALDTALQGDMTIAKLHYPKVLNDSRLGIKATVNYESRLDYFISSLNDYKSEMTLTQELYDKYKYKYYMLTIAMYKPIIKNIGGGLICYYNFQLKTFSLLRIGQL